MYICIYVYKYVIIYINNIYVHSYIKQPHLDRRTRRFDQEDCSLSNLRPMVAISGFDQLKWGMT